MRLVVLKRFTKYKQMLKASNESITKVWKPYKTLEPFYRGGKIELSHDEEQIFCEFEGNVKIVKGDDVSNVSSILDDVEAQESIATFCVNPTKKYEMVAATEKFSLQQWKFDSNGTKELLKTIKAHRMPILCMDYDNTGTLVATGSADKSVRVWDIEKGYGTHNFTGNHHDVVKVVKFHPDPKRLQLFSASNDGSLNIYDLIENRLVASFQDHAGLPHQLAWSADGYTLISCGIDKILNFYELREFQHIKTVPVQDELETVVILSDNITQFLSDKDAASSSSSIVVTAGNKGVLRFFQMSMKGKDVSSFTLQPLMEVPLSAIPSSSNAISEEMQALRTVSDLKILKKTNQLLAVTKDSNFCYYSIGELGTYCKEVVKQQSISAQSILANTNKKSKAKATETAVVGTLTIPNPEKIVISNLGDILDIAYIPTNSEDQSALKFRAALVTNSPQVRIMNDRYEMQVLDGHTDIVLSVDISPDGTWLATASKDSTCRVWSTSSMTCIGLAQGHVDAVGSVAISQFQASYVSRKAMIASGGSDKIIKRWALPTYNYPTESNATVTVDKLLATHSVRAHDKDINCLAMAPNDSVLASASQDKTIRLWEPQTLTPITTLTGHRRGVWKVVFSPIDKVLMSSSGDRTIKLWSLVDYTVLKTFEGHTASVLAAQFVNHSTQILSSASDGLMRLWTIRTGECEATLPDLHNDRVWAVETLPTIETGDRTDHYALSGSSDGKLILWKDATAEEELQQIQEREEILLAEQELNNFMRRKDYTKALKTGLKLNLQRKTLQILQTILEDDSKLVEKVDMNDGSDSPISTAQLFVGNWSRRLDEQVRALNRNELIQLIVWVVDWNTNSLHSYMCQVLLGSIFRHKTITQLYSYIHSTEDSDKRLTIEQFRGLLAYSERHFQRISRLNEASYFLEYLANTISVAVPAPTTISQGTKDEEKTMIQDETVDDKEEVVVQDDKKSNKKRKQQETVEESNISSSAVNKDAKVEESKNTNKKTKKTKTK